MSRTQGQQKQKIIDAARHIIASKGFRSLTLREVASEAGMSPGNLHYYFKSKNMILYEIMDMCSSEAEQLSLDVKENKWTRGELHDIQMDMLNRRVLDADGNKMLMHLIYEALSGDEELLSRVREKYNSWVDNMEDIFIGHFNVPRSPLTHSIAILLDALVDGMCWKHLIGLETVQDAGVKFFFDSYYSGKLDEFWEVLNQGKDKTE